MLCKNKMLTLTEKVYSSHEEWKHIDIIFKQTTKMANCKKLKSIMANSKHLQLILRCTFLDLLESHGLHCLCDVLKTCDLSVQMQTQIHTSKCVPVIKKMFLHEMAIEL